MNRQDVLALQTILAEYVSDKKIRYDDVAADTRDGARQQRQIGKQIDTAVKLYRKLKPAPITAAREPKTVEAGRCPCGAAVTISQKYTVKMDDTTTISRTCGSCGRTNEIDIEVCRELRPVNWMIRECMCGDPLRVRNDYAGFGFADYVGPLDFRGSTRKNRTTKVTCKRCGCRWSFAIMFFKGEETGTVQRSIDTVVLRCEACAKIDDPQFVPVEPKPKRARKG